MTILILHAHPAATSCRPILMFAEEEGLALDVRTVDVFAGEQATPAYTALNRNPTMPLLVDGDFRLAEQCGSSAYGVIYPQVMPHLRRADGSAQQAHLAWSPPASRPPRWRPEPETAA